MKTVKFISGFSKLTQKEKINYITSLVKDKTGLQHDIESHFHRNNDYQILYNDLSENVISNYYLPYSIAPNFVINDKVYAIPLVTDESSVVAASASAAKFWSTRGGFRAKVLSTIKSGHIHIIWDGGFEKLNDFFKEIRQALIDSTDELTRNMRNRGGGIADLQLLDKTEELSDYYQVCIKFETCDSMGANFINSALEKMAEIFDYKAKNNLTGNCEIIMSILSNYAPECIVESHVECQVDQLDSGTEKMNTDQFVRRFKMAVDIAINDVYRAVTHNKGIYNGIDAVLLATGNDFRAVEAQGHAYASELGKYRSLSSVIIENGIFRFNLRIPLTIGTTGGITRLHPLAKRSFELLGNPSSVKLMEIVASVGLACNFSAIKSLVTKGIQKGHMQLHLSNILRNYGATPFETEKVNSHFKKITVTHHSVRDFLENLRNSSHDD